MRISLRYGVWLLPLLSLMQGCDQKAKPAPQQTLAPPIVDAPPPKPATVSTADLPPPVIGDAQPAKPADTTPTNPPEPAKKPARHPKKPATSTTAPAETANANPPAAAPSVSAIGQLSGGASGDARSQTEDSINVTEKGVNSITRPLNDSEKKTAAQIHEFIKQAREALTSGDVDGAQTLVKKAKVLLAELNE